jgi:mono/diheme cytochrome c family protein
MNPKIGIRHAAWLLVFIGAALALFFGNRDALAQPTTPAAKSPAQNANAGNVANGKKVYATLRCGGCHGRDGEGGTGTSAAPQIAPPGGELSQFIDTVRNPKSPMTPYSTSDASDAQLADVFAYLKSVAPPAAAATATTPARNAENGRRLFATDGCYECHDNEGQGGTGTGPRLAPNPIAFSAFTHEIRQPSDIMPPYTAKVLTDAQLADIYAFLKSIPEAPSASSIPLLQ